MTDLPHANDLFETYFACWLDEKARQRREVSGIWPDVSRISPQKAAQRERAKTNDFVTLAQAKIIDAMNQVRMTWPSQYNVSLPVSMKWIDAFDRYYDRQTIRELIERSDPHQHDNEYIHSTVEYGTVMAIVFKRFIPDLKWSYELPFWESALYDARTETDLHIFHWAIKKLSDYGVEDGYAAKVCASLQWLRGKNVWQAAVKEFRG
jgi:hypothetical protein